MFGSRQMNRSTWILLAMLTFGSLRSADAADRNEPRRMVLVELYTSQGCDMCPAAEEILGRLAARAQKVVPIAFHVDYFNTPWKDVFSDPLYTQRQQVYNQVYTGPRPEEYGLFYTPMLMIDGQQSVNGRDPEAALAAIGIALARKPAVELNVDLELTADGLSGKANVTVAGRTNRFPKSPLLLCAVLREDGVVTNVLSGENAGKALVARFPARQTKFAFVELSDNSPASRSFTFAVDPSWNRRKLRLAVFAQDKRTAAVYQAADFPWRSTASGGSSTSGKPSEAQPIFVR